MTCGCSRRSGGRRRLANVRKLMRLAREHEAQHGLRPACVPGHRRRSAPAAADAARERGAGRGRGARRRAADDDPPLQGPGVRHRLRGRPRPRALVLPRASCGWRRRALRAAAGRAGQRPARAGAATIKALGEERQHAEQAEERRLFYVAMTRARERLVLSGAARLENWPDQQPWHADRLDSPGARTRLRRAHRGGGAG